MPVWRRDDASQGHALKLTAAGLKATAVDEGSEGAIEPSKATQPQRPPDETNASRPDAAGEHAKTSAPRAGQQAGAGDRPAAAVRWRAHPNPDKGYRMVAAYDAGGAYRATQARICRRPHTGRHGESVYRSQAVLLMAEIASSPTRIA